MRSQLLDGNSQSDVTVQDVESLSRDPKRSKTVHVVGPLPTNCPDREKTYSELSVSLGQEDIFQVVDEEEEVEGEGEGEGEGAGDVEGDEKEGEEEEE